MVLAFRMLGWLEGLSFLILLLFAMPMKYIYEDPSYVKFFGMAHGILFMGYVLLSVYVADILKWNIKTRIYALLASVMPLGTFIFENKFLSQNNKSK